MMMKILKRLFLLILFVSAAGPTPAFAIPDVETYDGLLAAIRQVRVETERRVEQAVNQEKVREAWETGKLIGEHILKHKERADYGEQVLKRLAVDLETSHTELSFMLQFFRTYPIYPAPDKLTWSHYRELLSLNEPETRKEVADEAIRQRWSHRQVREEVRRRQVGSPNREIEKLPVSGPGNLQTYTLVKPHEGPDAGELALDLGFTVNFRPEEVDLEAFGEGDVVRLEHGKLAPAAAGSSLRVGTYRAFVTEIIDGDTFHARVDLGFGVTVNQKLRLRGLDAPVLESSDGREAKEFLEKRLPSRSEPILIQTTKSDKYDRYLVDVWVGDEYLNQALLDQGLAVAVSE